MIRILSLSILVGLSPIINAETIKANNFTMSELEHIEYTATLFYTPKQDDYQKGYKKGIPVELVHQKFLINYKDENRTITKIATGKLERGSILITEEDPQQLGISSLDGRYKGLYVIMDNTQKIDNYSDYKLRLKIFPIDQYLNTEFTASAVILDDNIKGKRHGFKQKVVLAPNKPIFTSVDDTLTNGLTVKLEARAKK